MAKKNSDTPDFLFIEKIIIMILALFAWLCTVLAVRQGFYLMRRKDQTEPAQTVEKTETEEFRQDQTVLKPTPDAGWQYADETLFLGDSNTVRLMQYYREDGETYTNIANTIAVAGMGADAISTLPCMQFETGVYTMIDAAAMLQPKRIILTFGTNNLGWYTAQDFAAVYADQIRLLQAAWPYADIIVNSIYPFAQNTTYTSLSMDDVLAFNEAIIRMCEENGWKYLNSFEALTDSDSGYIRMEYIDTFDGLHLNEKGVQAVMEYVRTHAYETEDRRGPLAEIPLIYGPLTELLTQNAGN